MLDIKGFKVAYGRGKDIVKNASLTLEEGKVTILLGPNGSGKSTLLKAIAGAIKSREGSILENGVEILKNRAKTLSYVPQNPAIPSLTVFETVLSGRLPLFGYRCGKQDEEAVWKVLDELGLTSFASRRADELSGGETQKVMIARALVSGPKAILLDEPTASLDVANLLLVRKSLSELAKQGFMLLVAVHDISFALNLGDVFYGMKQGEIAFCESKDSITPESLESLYGVKPTLIDLNGEIAVHFGGQNR